MKFIQAQSESIINYKYKNIYFKFIHVIYDFLLEIKFFEFNLNF